MDSFYAELSSCKFKPIGLNLVAPPFAGNEFSNPYINLEYQELELCSKQELKLSNDEITQIEKNVRTQSSRGTKFFKHRTGRVLELLKASKHLI